MKALLPGAVVYDTALADSASRQAVNRCDIAFVCVPTPAAADGRCDVAAVEECAQWLKTPLIVLRSTVAPGTTQRLASMLRKHIVFQPEYLGETVAHPYADSRRRQFIVLGGTDDECARVVDFYSQIYNSTVRFHVTDATTAELAKYMENAFFASKVLFCTEFRRIADALGVPYSRLREVWLADTRISPDHTFAFAEDPGFGGKCLPKDLQAILASARAAGVNPRFLQAVHDTNRTYRANRND